MDAHGRAKVGRLVITYLRQHCADTGCNLEDLPGAMDDREDWLLVRVASRNKSIIAKRRSKLSSNYII